MSEDEDDTAIISEEEEKEALCVGIHVFEGKQETSTIHAVCMYIMPSPAVF